MENLENRLNRYKKIVSTLCYVQDKGKTLMVHRNKSQEDLHYGKYNGLGGKCEPGEDPYACVKREIREEAGIDIEPIYIGNITFQDFSPEGDWEVHVFRAEGYKGKVGECNEGELVWVDTLEITTLNLWDGDKIFLEYLNSGKFFIGNFEYKEGHMVGHKMYFPKM
jgi:8-oxo-dGTP diphosphatase